MTEITLHVIPNSKNFEIVGWNEWNNELKIKIKSPPTKGKANQELEKELTKFFGEKVEIIKGQKSHTKKVLVNKTIHEIKSLIK